MRKKAPFAATAFAALATTALGATTAHAQTFGYCTFADAGSLTLNGSAVQGPTSALSLTSDATWTSGSAFSTTPVAWSASTSFSTSFVFALTPDHVHGEGISFLVQSDGDDALGGTGGGIGYGETDTTADVGITPSVAVEFDTYFDTWDPNGNHVGLMLNGDDTTHVAYATPSFTMLGGGTLYAWIDYDAATTTLDVYLAQAAGKPDTPLLTTTVDIASIVGTSAYVGFTGATGSETNEQDIDAWEFSTVGEPCVCGGNADCSGANAVCDTATQTCGVTAPPEDAGPPADAGIADTAPPMEAAAAVDAGSDATLVIDSGEGDTAPSAPVLDSGMPTGPVVDSGAAAVDSGYRPPAPNGPSPAPAAVTQAGEFAGGACSCRAAGSTSDGSSGIALAALAVLGAYAGRRRRRA